MRASRPQNILLMKNFTLAVVASLFAGAAYAQTAADAPTAAAWGKTAAAEAVAAAPAAHKVADASTLITEQPEGTLYKNMYTYANGFESMWGMIYEAKKDGTVKDIVVADDGSVYIKNPISFMNTDSWIKGHKTNGDTVAVELPQLIYLLDNGDDTKVKYYANRMVYKLVDGNNQYVPDPASQTIKYVWRNDSLIKLEKDILLGMVSEGGSWNGLGDLECEVTVNKFVNAAPQDPSKAVKYIMTYYPSEQSAHQKVVDVVIEGSDIYINGVDSDIPSAWAHGTIKGSLATFTGMQFLGFNEGKGAYKFFTPASVKYNESTYTTDYKLLSKMNFIYNSKKQTLSCTSDGFISNYGYRQIAMEMQVFMKPSLVPWEGVVDKPQNPVIVQYEPASSSAGWLIFGISKYNVQDSFMDAANVYYNVYFDDEKVTFYPDQYKGISKEMTDVPVDFSESTMYDFQTYGSQHRVVIYDRGMERVGVQAFYLDGGTKLASDIVYIDDPSGIAGVSASAASVVSTQYFDLSGRRVSAPDGKGVYIRTQRLSDGSVRSGKMMAK